ncbi:hypothetical protein PAXRUDRAFT_11900 [Paxillus rubicundulus Ve08.2h10]|uniref:Fungal-type protein kinase domain-containing protein n=1 Tax=Paxillus rubicundulus Ve08.2h10 TaxID=930991 RepID=A0A0D0DBV8_9AGAM|nr:hypothetical protein PAXRUDRAFT_11900 [Paxillus rubicundulus Ve08.2h10]
MRTHPSETAALEKRTRDAVDSVLQDELHDAQYLTDDLGDLMFGSLISTKTAKGILEGLFKREMGREVRYRFVAPIDTRHAFPFAHGPDKEDMCMRPDFVVLPADTCEITTNSEYGTIAWRIKPQTPTKRFVTALTVAQEIVTFMRVDGSGVEHLDMQLERGRSSPEFVRVLLAFALGHEALFGQSSVIDVAFRNKSTMVAMLADKVPASQLNVPFSSDLPAQTSYRSSAPISQSNTQASGSAAGASRSGQKRKKGDEDGAENPPPPARKRAPVEIDQRVQLPTTLFSVYTYEGTLFNAASLRGRGTTVVLVQKQGTRVVLKMAWQEVTRVLRQAEILNTLQRGAQCVRYAHVLIPTSATIDEDHTLGVIRAFTDSQIRKFPLEETVFSRFKGHSCDVP